MFHNGNHKLRKALLPLLLTFNCVAAPLAMADSTSVTPLTPASADTVADSTSVHPPLVLAPASEKVTLPVEGLWRASQLNCVAKIESMPDGRLRFTIANVDPSEGRPYLYFSPPSVRASWDRVAQQKGEAHVERLVPKDLAVSIIGFSPESDVHAAGDGRYEGHMVVQGKKMKTNITIRSVDQNHLDVKVCAKIRIIVAKKTFCKSATWERVPENVVPAKSSVDNDPFGP